MGTGQIVNNGNLTLNTGDTLELEIGVSVGYCVATTGGVTLEQLVAQADASLYEAKRAGRGCFRGGTI